MPRRDVQHLANRVTGRSQFSGLHACRAAKQAFQQFQQAWHRAANPLIFQRDPNDLRRGRPDISRLMRFTDIDCIHPRH